MVSYPLGHLKGLTNLQKLYLPTKVIDAGIAERQAVLPNSEIRK